MNATDYCPMAREYSIWNATVAALPFWTADLKVHVLSSAIKEIYIVFFYSTSTHLLCQQSDEVLFDHFMSTLSAAFESKLALEDEGSESSSENFNITTPLRRTSKIHHVTPCSTGSRQSYHRPVHKHLTYSSSEDNDDTPIDATSSPVSTSQVQYCIDALQQPSSRYTLNTYVNLEEEEEKDFPTVSLDDDHWNMEEILDKHLCIHGHSIPHELCPYPCPYLDYTTSSYYDTLDLSDISKFEDLMTTSSDPCPQ